MAPVLGPLYHAFAASPSLATSSWPIQFGPETRTKVCNIRHTAGADDSPAIQAAFQQCPTNSIIKFAKGRTYNLFSPVRATNLSNVEIRINGNIQFPDNIAEIQAKVASSVSDGLYGTSWLWIAGDSVSVHGSKDPKWGWFEGHGQQWWDQVLQVNRPRLATFAVTNGHLGMLKHHALIAWAWSIPATASNVLVEKIYADNRPTNGTRDLTPSFPFNTDGVNVGGQNVYVHNYFGYTGDDAISIVNKANNVTVKNVFAGFSSHGISIGSLGKNGSVASVSNVLVEDVTMEGAVYGARFKSWVGGNGIAENVTFRNFKLFNVSTPVFVTQNYYDQGLGKPNITSTNSTRLRNFRFENFEGYMNPSVTDGTCISNPCWNYVAGGDATQSIILDLYPNTANGLTFENFNVSPYQKKTSDTTVICDPTTLEPADLEILGFKCQNGPYVAQ